MKVNEKYIQFDKKPKLPFCHFNKRKKQYRTTVNNIDKVVELYNKDIDNAPQRIKDIYNEVVDRKLRTKSLLENGPQRESGWLFEHQQLAREIAEINDRFGFFYDTRTGKTIMSLQIIQDDIKENPHHKWLILCPLILIEQAWLPDATEFFPDLNIVNLHDSTKKKRLKKFKQEANVYIQNIESFVNYRQYIEELGIHGCFVDESSTMKSHKAKFAKQAVEFSQKVKRWYLLSGVPAPNGEHEYYRQLQSIDPYAIHHSYTQFKEYFFVNVSFSDQFEKLEIREDKKDELYELLREYTVYVDKEDVLNTPGREFKPVEIEMPKELKKQYDQLRKELYLELGDVEIITPSAGAKINKLNQLTSGFVIDTAAVKHNKYNEDKMQESYLLSTYKFDRLDELLRSIGDEQAIIWCYYHKEFEVLEQRIDCVCVYGKTNIKEKNENLKLFKEGKVKYLVANPASCDKGLTLTNAHHAIYFSLNHSYELFKQSMERIYGDVSKQKDKCTYHILIAKGTVDKAIYNSITTKGNTSKAILDHLKGGISNVKN